MRNLLLVLLIAAAMTSCTSSASGDRGLESIPSNLVTAKVQRSYYSSYTSKHYGVATAAPVIRRIHKMYQVGDIVNINEVNFIVLALDTAGRTKP